MSNMMDDKVFQTLIIKPRRLSPLWYNSYTSKLKTMLKPSINKGTALIIISFIFNDTLPKYIEDILYYRGRSSKRTSCLMYKV